MTAVLSLFLVAALAQASQPDLTGVYKAVPNGVTLQSGLKNDGSPGDIPLLPAAKAQLKDPKDDPWKSCKPAGEFRLMARPDTKIELVPAPGVIYMFFEDLQHGVMRSIYTGRNHPEKTPSLWFGDSVGRWEGDTLVVDTIGFNEETWLNDAGAQHSTSLHLVERIKPVLGGVEDVATIGPVGVHDHDR